MENKEKFEKAEAEEITLEEDVITQSVTTIGPVGGESVQEGGSF